MMQKPAPGKWIVTILPALLILVLAQVYPAGSLLADTGSPGWISAEARSDRTGDRDIRGEPRGKLREDPAQYYRRGRHLQDRGRHELAAEEFRSAVLVEPGHANALAAMGISLDAMGRHEQAERAYREALTRAPDRADIYNNLGYSRMLRGDIDRAIEYFEQAVSIDDTTGRYRNNLGMAYVKTGNLDAALAAFRETGDSAQQARKRFARVLEDNGYQQEAKKQRLLANTLEGFDRNTDDLYDHDVPVFSGPETSK